MRKISILSAMGMCLFFFMHLVGCSSSTGTPVATTLPPTFTSTSGVPVATATFTFTSTPTGPTATPTATVPGATPTWTPTPLAPTPTLTGTPAILPLFTTGGGLETYDDTVNVWASGTQPTDLISFNNTSTPPGPYGSNTYFQSFGISNWNGSSWASFALSTDSTAYPSGYDFSPYSEVTFEACANIAEPTGITIYAEAASITTALTTSWQSFQFSVAPSGTSTATLSVGISNAVTLPVTVYLDNVQYQQ